MKFNGLSGPAKAQLQYTLLDQSDTGPVFAMLGRFGINAVACSGGGKSGDVRFEKGAEFHAPEIGRGGSACHRFLPLVRPL